MLTTRVGLPEILSTLFSGLACEPFNSESLKQLWPFLVTIQHNPAFGGQQLYKLPFLVLARNSATAVIYTREEIQKQHPDWRAIVTYRAKVSRFDHILARANKDEATPDEWFTVTEFGVVAKVTPP